MSSLRARWRRDRTADARPQRRRRDRPPRAARRAHRGADARARPARHRRDQHPRARSRRAQRHSHGYHLGVDQRSMGHVLLLAEWRLRQRATLPRRRPLSHRAVRRDQPPELPRARRRQAPWMLGSRTPTPRRSRAQRRPARPRGRGAHRTPSRSQSSGVRPMRVVSESLRARSSRRTPGWSARGGRLVNAPASSGADRAQAHVVGADRGRPAKPRSGPARPRSSIFAATRRVGRGAQSPPDRRPSLRAEVRRLSSSRRRTDPRLGRVGRRTVGSTIAFWTSARTLSHASARFFP